MINHCDRSSQMTNALFKKEQSLHHKHSSGRREKQRLCRSVTGYSICWGTEPRGQTNDPGLVEREKMTDALRQYIYCS